MTDIRKARKALITRILEGDGQAPHAQRRAAFDNAALDEPLATLIGKVAIGPTRSPTRTLPPFVRRG